MHNRKEQNLMENLKNQMEKIEKLNLNIDTMSIECKLNELNQCYPTLCDHKMWIEISIKLVVTFELIKYEVLSAYITINQFNSFIQIFLTEN